MAEDLKQATSYFSNLTFTLVNGPYRHVFKGDLFAKMSKRCSSLLEQGITEGIIMRKLDKEVFDIFVSACQLKPFKITTKNAYELLNLSREWEIPSLEKFANDYINSKDLNPPPPKDYVQILQDRVKENLADIDDIRSVAANINEAMDDDRFIAMPPEIIFQTILAADPHQVDAEKLLKFTMMMFDKKPSTGIPLTLLVDFEKMTPEQRSRVFGSRKMHEENVNYFVAWALSEIRDRNAAATKELVNRNNLRIAKLADAIGKARKADKYKYYEDHEEELNNITNQIQQQEKEIGELLELIKKDNEEEKELEEKRQSLLQANQEAIQEIEKDGEQCQISVAGTTAQVRAMVRNQIAFLREELERETRAVADDNDAKCDEVLEALKVPVKEQADNITRMLERTKHLGEVIEKTNRDIHNTKSLLTAKIVRDKLRFDEFIRDTDKRFEIFNQSSQKWDLTSDEVEKSEKLIEGFEADMNKFCPIRGNSNYSPPTSPKMITKKPEKPVEKEPSVHEKSHLNEEEEEEEATDRSSSNAPLSPPQSP